MDPNETLRQLRVYLELPGRWSPMEEYNARQLMTNLDEWLSKGGFLPAEWNKGARLA